MMLYAELVHCETTAPTMSPWVKLRPTSTAWVTLQFPAMGGDPIRAAQPADKQPDGVTFLTATPTCSRPVSQGEPSGNERSGLPEFEIFVRMPTEMRSQSGAGTIK
jgi:hypothetical protein